jgi:ADP-ribose pyrophosphatase YjhB (NUDIX family)
MTEIRITVDVVIFTIQEGRLGVLLVRRGIPPYEGAWAIPGGFILPDEGLERAARRELEEETAVRDVYLEQLYTFGEPGRDPRGRVVTVAYYSLISPDRAIRAGSDAAEARWWPMDGLPDLAFDHAEILEYALERLRNKLEYTTVGFQLLPERFTLSELQQVYEAILGRRLDKRNFRRKIALLAILTPLKEYRRQGASRPARLYRFSAERFEKLKDKGILFPF